MTDLAQPEPLPTEVLVQVHAVGVNPAAPDYLAAVRRVRDWPVARPIWFCGLGLGFLVIATMSWVGVYQPVLFWVRAVQTVLLVLVVPLFLGLGRPVTLTATVFPRADSGTIAVTAVDDVAGRAASWA